MRILFFSHYFPPEGNAPAVRTFEHCTRWAAAGHEVTVVTCAPNHPRGKLYAGYRNRLRQIEYFEGVRVVRVMTYLAANEGAWRRTASYLSYLLAAVPAGLLERRPDVVIATSPQFFCGWAGVLVSRLRRRPFLLEIRDLWPESIMAVGAIRSRATLRLLEILERGMYRAARRIVTVGDGYRERLIERGVGPHRISVVMNGVDRKRFFPREADRDLAGRLGVAGRFVVTYCGTIGLAHGLDVVLRAGALLIGRGRADIVFLLVGDGARFGALRDAAAHNGLGNVVFAGRLGMRDIPGVLSLSDACLVHLRSSPTFTTVMPSKIFEAAAMARPVILGVDGFARTFVEEAGCGLCIEPENEHELVEAVLRLSGDAALRARLGRAGLDLAGACDRDRLAERYLGVIEQVAAPAAKDSPE